MERESFENHEIAAFMNERLICIKVDREERPDVDQIYMETVVRLTGSGGWPLNVFCTPDGRPFFGGTYYPPERAHGRPSWPEVVDSIARVFHEERERVNDQAAQIFTALQAEPKLAPSSTHADAILAKLCEQLMERADRQFGGFGGAPKFPTPTNLEALLSANAQHQAVAGTLDHVLHTLKRMSHGGIYDQIGGGFHRYSVDAEWLVPHFEKMLYDQGQLLHVYAEAYRQTGDADLIWPIEETIAFLEREMRDPDNGFYASQDADSEGEEGLFYIWNPGEISSVLGDTAGPAFSDAYDVSARGNFENTGSSVLSQALAGDRPRFAKERAQLFNARKARIAPDTDTKVVASWLGYTIGGIASAAAVLDRSDWLDAATWAANFVETHLIDPAHGLMRIWDGKQAKIPGFLDDHAALLVALLDLTRAGAQSIYMDRAIQIAETICGQFFDPKTGHFFFASGRDATLIFRPGSDSDGATPAAAGLATLGLVRIAAISGRDDFKRVVEAVLKAEMPQAERVPMHLPTFVRAAALHQHGIGLAVILGQSDDPACQTLAAAARSQLGVDNHVVVIEDGASPSWLDAEWLRGREIKNDSATAYLCRGRVCSLPANRPDELRMPG